MSRNAVFLAIIFYFAVASAISFFMEIADPKTSLGVALIGATLWGGVKIFVASGIVPVFVWTFEQFRVDKVVGPLAVWAMLGMIMGAFAVQDNLFGRLGGLKELESKYSKDQTLAGVHRSTFSKALFRACMEKQRNSKGNQERGISDNDLVDYCECHTESIPDVLTSDELTKYAASGRVPQTMLDKIDAVTTKCTRPLKR